MDRREPEHAKSSRPPCIAHNDDDIKIVMRAFQRWRSLTVITVNPAPKMFEMDMLQRSEAIRDTLNHMFLMQRPLSEHSDDQRDEVKDRKPWCSRPLGTYTAVRSAQPVQCTDLLFE